jgi:glutamine phosphoribosylpyrophosphate amidotransferase
MCGVIGYIGKSIDKNLVERLVFESEIRGIHHTGRVTAEVLEPKKLRGYGNGIIHTRYCTSGKTNQPLKVKGNVLAFNGVIDMGTKKEMEKRWGIKMTTDNDGEILLQTCKTPETLLLFIKNRQCSFAGVMVMDGRFVALRNKFRPLWMHKDKKNNVYIASTKDIFIRSGVKTNLKELEPLKIYEW